jgi:methyl coenzyme M reductase gamma subunit
MLKIKKPLKPFEKKKKTEAEEFEQNQRELNEEIESFKNSSFSHERGLSRTSRGASAQLERFVTLHETRRTREISLIKRQYKDDEIEEQLLKRIRIDPPLTKEDIKNRTQFIEEDNVALREFTQKMAEIHARAARRFAHKCRAYSLILKRKPVNDEQVDWLFLKYSK